MARSVSVHPEAVAVAYLPYDGSDDFDWSDFIYGLINVIVARYPSFERYNRWLGREDQAILRNGHAYVVVAEYCGLVSVSLVPFLGSDHDLYGTESEDALAVAWCDQVGDHLVRHLNAAFGGLRSLGHASNGEQFFTATS